MQELIDTAKQIDVRNIIERKSLFVQVNMFCERSKIALDKDVVGKIKLEVALLAMARAEVQRQHQTVQGFEGDMV